nr:benzoate/H(+) symporter BenE family transporter [Acinetobacter colistiniresistens]
MNIKSFIEDFSVSAFAAGFTTVLVGVTSSIIIVFQAATALGANSAEIASWIWALGLTLGLSSIVLSLYYKIPLIAAWSTPGAAYLAINGHQVTLNEAVGAFIISGLLITIAGFSSLFKK